MSMNVGHTVGRSLPFLTSAATRTEQHVQNFTAERARFATVNGALSVQKLVRQVEWGLCGSYYTFKNGESFNLQDYAFVQKTEAQNPGAHRATFTSGDHRFICSLDKEGSTLTVTPRQEAQQDQAFTLDGIALRQFLNGLKCSCGTIEEFRLKIDPNPKAWIWSDCQRDFSKLQALDGCVALHKPTGQTHLLLLHPVGTEHETDTTTNFTITSFSSKQ